MNRSAVKIIVEALLVLILWQVVWNGNDIVLQNILGSYSEVTRAVLYFGAALCIFLILYAMEGMTFKYLDTYGI